MKKEVRNELIRRLESGEYQQGTQYLKQRKINNQICFCINGLICDIVDPHGWSNIEENYAFRHRNEKMYPSVWVYEAAGLSETTAINLGLLNDQSRKTFPQLAQYIREHIPETE